MGWYTYTEARARERARVLKFLMRENLLTEEERGPAIRLIRQLEGRLNPGEPLLQVYASGGGGYHEKGRGEYKESSGVELLERVEEALAESKRE